MASSTTPAARNPQQDGLCQPCIAAFEKPKTMQNIPDDTASAPGTSSLGRRVRGWRRSRIAAPVTATAAKTTFTYRHQRQDRYSVSRPPSSRPRAAPEPAIAPNTPNARPRSLLPLNVVVSRDSADGAMNAPNAPCRARAATSMPKLVAAPPAADAAAKPISPEMNVTFRPSSEETFPPSSSRLPKASA